MLNNGGGGVEIADSDVAAHDDNHDLKIPINATVTIYAIVASFSSLIAGYNTAMITPAILFIPDSMPLTTTTTAAIVTSLLFGATVGTLIAGPLADTYGRRRVMSINNIFIACMAFIMGSARSAWELVIERTVFGIGIGIATVVPTIYLAETMPTIVRGRFGAYNQLNVAIGASLAYIVAYALLYYCSRPSSWRWMFASGGLLACIDIMFGMMVLPESPRWLILHGRRDEGLEVLETIYHTSSTAADQPNLASQTYHDICRLVDIQNGNGYVGEEQGTSNRNEPPSRPNGKIPWKELFAPPNRKPVLVVIGMQFFRRAMGNSAVIYFMSLIFKQAGFSDANALLASVVSSIPQLLCLVVIVSRLDRWGRRRVLLISTIGVCASLSLLGFALDQQSLRHQGYLVLLAIIAERASYSCGFGTVVNVLLPEILPMRVRAKGSALSLAVNSLVNLIITLSYTGLAARIGAGKVFWGFAGIAALAFIYIWFFIYETGNRSLERLEHDTTLQHGPAIVVVDPSVTTVSEQTSSLDSKNKTLSSGLVMT